MSISSSNNSSNNSDNSIFTSSCSNKETGRNDRSNCRFRVETASTEETAILVVAVGEVEAVTVVSQGLALVVAVAT